MTLFQIFILKALKRHCVKVIAFFNFMLNIVNCTALFYNKGKPNMTTVLAFCETESA